MTTRSAAHSAPALMTQRFGEEWTRDFTTAHERLPNNPATAEAMDLHNNETVVVAPNGDGEKLAWSDSVKEGEAGCTSKSTVPGQAPTPTGAGPGGIYDPGEPGGYGTSAGGY
ncbi:DUF6973 domain-containing protein [Mycobacterium sp. NPDC051198]